MPAPTARTFVIAAALRRLIVDSANGARGFAKDPAAVLDFAWDWSAWLAGASTPADTIVSHTVAIEARVPKAGENPALITELTRVSDSRVGGVVTAWLRGGVAGSTLAVTCQVVTTGGRTDERSFYLQIGEQ